MAKDEQAARKARAEGLREQIARITNHGAPGGEKPQRDSHTQIPARQSPREFVHERMRELDKKKP
jgi:hypothetical protein